LSAEGMNSPQRFTNHWIVVGEANGMIFLLQIGRQRTGHHDTNPPLIEKMNKNNSL